MRKILFFIFFLIGFVKADTLVVDNNPHCSFFNIMGVCIGSYVDCTGGNNYKNTIQDAVNAASAGDTIKICSGTYNEVVTVDKDNLTLKGVDGQSPSDVVIDAGSNTAITLKKENITLENFEVKSSGSYGIHGNWDATGEHVFKDLIIDANSRGIYLEHGSKQTFEDLNITAGDIGIYTRSDVDGEHVFKNLNIHSIGNAIQVDKGGKSFEDLNLVSDSGRGIDVEDTLTDLVFKDIQIHSKWEGILTRYNVTGTKTFSDINISSEGKSIYIDGGQTVTLKKIEANSSNDMGIYLSANPVGDHIFDDIKVNSKGVALFVGNGGKDFENLELNSTDNRGIEIDNTTNNLTMNNITIHSKNEGIYAPWNVDGDHILSDISINSKGVGISFAKGFSSLKDVNITSKNRGIDIAPYRDVTIDNADINTSEGKEGIMLRSGDNKAHILIENSKIYGNQSYDGIYTSNGYITVDSLCIDKAKRGIYFPWNVIAPIVKNTNIKDTSDWAIMVDADRTYPAKINNNCLSGAKLAYSNGTQHNFDGNYWDGVTDIDNDGDIDHNDAPDKIQNGVIDHNPLSSCSNTNVCSDNNYCNANAMYNVNLVQGGTAENSDDINKWITESGHDFARANYSTGWAGSAPPPSNDPDESSNNYFFFGDDGSVTVYQEIDICNLASDIDKGEVEFNLSGFHGGYRRQNDTIEIKANFFDEKNTIISSVTTGAFKSRSKMQYFEILNKLPIGTRKVKIYLIITKVDGTDADGYADNISFILKKNNLQQCFFDDFSSNDIGSKWKIIKEDNYTPNIQNGQLYLTNNGNDISSGVSLIGKFPAKDNYVVIEFEENSYGTNSWNGADGVSIVFSNASVTPVAGAFGGSLGYAQKTTINGFAGGWLGIGLDEYGNFSNPTEGREGGPGRKPDSIAIRGKGNGTSGYKYIDGTNPLSPGIDDNNRYNDNESSNWYTSNTPLHYKYKITIDTRDNKTLVKVYRDTGSGYQPILDTDASSNGEPPEYFKFSLTGSTGGANNYHTFDNIKISALNCGTLGQEETKNYRFDAWDDNKNINERILTTKLINRNFKVTLASLDENGNDYQEFNGTVCSRIVGDGYEGAWNKTVWNNEKEKNVTFNVDMALKSARVNIHWINDNLSADCPLQNETNESNSTDNFAVRPAYYKIDGVNKNLKAGADFSVLIKAYDANNQFIKDFNFSNAPVELDFNDSVGCKTGELNSTSSPLKTSADFVNGEANVTLNYTEVGDLNISVKEYNNSSEFAGVDEKQEDNTILLIGEGNSTVKHFNPYKFEINATYENYKDGNFTYYDGDLNITSHMDLNITAKNKENKTTENYNKECYAKDIDINLSHNSVYVDVNKILYKYKDASGNMHGIFSVDKDNDVNITYSKDNFTTDHNGTARIDVYLNFDRNISNPVNPFEFEITSIDVNDSDANGSLDLNKKVKYYYGSLMLDDILAVQNDFNKTYSFVVYDDNDSDMLKPDSKESAYDWYENIYHRKIDGNVSSGEIVVSSDYNASHNINKSTEKVSVNVSQDDNGHITFEINRKDSSVNFAVVHLLSPNLKWLWYSKFGDEYNISSDSTCLSHLCFTVTWQKTNDVGEVGSGSFTGTEANVTESNSTKRGVKIFR